MSKISQYLNEHLTGDVTTADATRYTYATDGSILAAVPDLVVYPSVTDDIRKLARFTYQLAQKGHILPMSPRGSGLNQTGAAISDGIIIDTPTHMNRVFEFDQKQRLVRVQPGATLGAINAALQLHGFHIPYEGVPAAATIGGAIASNTHTHHGTYIGDSVAELEVVLANGDIMQTKRLSRRELSSKKGLQTMEGAIYRAIDTLLDDSQSTIKTIAASRVPANAGYPGIAQVRRRGMFDLTPLFIGSQGTLGIVSEMILEADLYNEDLLTFAVLVESYDDMVRVINTILEHQPESLHVVDSRLAKLAYKAGRRHAVVAPHIERGDAFAAVLVGAFGDFSERTRQRKVKKLFKDIDRYSADRMVAEDLDEARKLRSIENDLYATCQIAPKASPISPLFSGVYIPPRRVTDFLASIQKLTQHYRVALPFTASAISSIYSFWPSLPVRSTQDKQALFKLYDAFSALVIAHGGSVTAGEAEGRLKAPFVVKEDDAGTQALYQAIRQIFDPHGTLNAGVKNGFELRDVAKYLRLPNGAAGPIIRPQ